MQIAFFPKFVQDSILSLLSIHREMVTSTSGFPLANHSSPRKDRGAVEHKNVPLMDKT